MIRRIIWIGLIGLIVLLGVGGFIFRENLIPLVTGLRAEAAPDTTATQRQGGERSDRVRGNNTAGTAGEAEGDVETTTIRPAAGSGQVSAAGNIALVQERSVVAQTEGIIIGLTVEVGDQVSVGDLLLALDTTDLERAAAQAELDVIAQQIALDALNEPADAAEVTAAELNLASAKETLLDVKAGPSQAELSAAEATLAAMQQRYQELLQGKSQAELTQLRANLDKTEIDLRQAQAAYDRIAYSDSVGTSSQAAALQQATIDYEAAQAAYQISVEPASQADLQDALSDIQGATETLETLRSQPTAAEVAAAESQVAGAQAQLTTLLNGPSDTDLQEAEISLQKAMLTLEEAQTDLALAQIYAPIDGTILSLAVAEGEKLSAGATALTMADLNALKLTVNVAEVDISKIQPGQPAQIAIDAWPDRIFQGEVTRIAPISNAEQGVVNYPVTIQLRDPDLSGVRPGMTAVADILDDELAAGWLVPTSAVREGGRGTRVIIIRNGQPTPIQVTVRGTQGEWTVVESTDLQTGDEAVGSVSTFLNDDQRGGFGGPFRPPR